MEVKNGCISNSSCLSNIAIFHFLDIKEEGSKKRYKKKEGISSTSGSPSHLPSQLDVMLAPPAWHAHVTLHRLDSHVAVSRAEESATLQGDDGSTWTSPLQNCQLLLSSRENWCFVFFVAAIWPAIVRIRIDIMHDHHAFGE